MDYLLTNEEINNVLYGRFGITRPTDGDELIAQAQLLKIIDLIDENGETGFTEDGDCIFGLLEDEWNHLVKEVRK